MFQNEHNVHFCCFVEALKEKQRVDLGLNDRFLLVRTISHFETLFCSKAGMIHKDGPCSSCHRAVRQTQEAFHEFPVVSQLDTSCHQSRRVTAAVSSGFYRLSKYVKDTKRILGTM